ncbi:11556_t:CDS:2 [Funneliformis mosseae]|uniref:11556_t:CDS:1 n=1 Tax=Funneliformis mosseae TaxID=27381 RepID=A0A9N8YN72_FUNMO|nr:11556_t:CDS:2 [Funneliformis mosseae]
MKFYLAACRNREEFPADRLVEYKASQPGGSLNVIDLAGYIIDNKIADILTLQQLIMERCEIEDDVWQ